MPFTGNSTTSWILRGLMTEKGVNIERIREELKKIDDPAELRRLRATLDGMLSRRTITPEQQAQMQQARKEKAKCHEKK